MAKKKRRRRRGIMGKIFLIILLLGAIYVTALFLPVFNITDIKVTGVEILKSEDIIKTSEIAKGQNLFRARVRKAEKKLSALPYVKDVNVKRKLPAGIEIVITEDKAVAYILKEGGAVAINREGEVLEALKEVKGDILQIPGMKIEESTVGEVIKYKNENFFTLQMQCLDALQQSGLLERARVLDIKNSSSIKITFDNGLLAEIGGSSEMDYKLKMVSTVLEQGYGEGIFNIANTSQPTYRKNE